MKDLASTLRLHIVAIAVCATVTFGYLFKGAYPVGLALLCGLDWCLVNLLNRATDVDEDRLNGIAATEFVARHARALTAGSLVVLAASLAWGFAALPLSLAVTRVVFHALGLGYSFRVVPTPKGMRRFKDLYVFKNTMSAVMFVLSVGLYPLLGLALPLAMSPAGVVAVIAYFFLFEHTFEVLYDLRDADGDRAVGVPTYPVVHGPAVSASLVYALCAASAAVLVVARVAGAVTTRELLMVAAPAAQAAFLKRRGPEGISRADCVGITYGGAGLLLFFLAGTELWRRAGLPMDL
ncbi:MAG: UbiA family prenyltransferase [Polyangiales bacterium]